MATKIVHLLYNALPKLRARAITQAPGCGEESTGSRGRKPRFSPHSDPQGPVALDKHHREPQLPPVEWT